MREIGEGLAMAFRLLAGGDPEVLAVTWLTLRVSGAATLISLAIGVPVGLLLSLGRPPGRRFWISLVNTGMALPPVAAGLLVYLLLARSGPLGPLQLLYTPTAMVIAQAVIAAPVVAGFTLAGVGQLDPMLRVQVLALGASRLQTWWLLVREARLSLLAAVMAGFGAVVSEVGAAMMVGGNIRGQTRVLTTAIVMETSGGHDQVALALTAVLLLLAYGVTLALTLVQQRRRPA